jgi:preprotein translocase subunit SecA
MDRLGIEEGEHIESKLVTRAVENAQKKVENLNFESRKHLLEYDDVANEQRKVIYAFRNNLLDLEFDIDSKIDENLKEYINNILQECNIIDGVVSEEFNYDKLLIKIKEELNFEILKDTIISDDYEDIYNKLYNILSTALKDKFAIAADDQRKEIERILYLQILDNAWREHLYTMDTLKTGIGLRGYNQKDPLVEYKKESYNLFVELIESIKSEIIKYLFAVQLRNEEEEKKELEALKAQMEESSKETFTNKEKPIQSKKIPRNAPCPCGSGKKYKHCCGKSGPKKGVLANKD